MTKLSPRIAVYPGSFDPVTLGDINVMERVSRLFDRLVVGVRRQPGEAGNVHGGGAGGVDPRGDRWLEEPRDRYVFPAWPSSSSSSAGRASWSAACGRSPTFRPS